MNTIIIIQCTIKQNLFVYDSDGDKTAAIVNLGCVGHSALQQVRYITLFFFFFFFFWFSFFSS